MPTLDDVRAGQINLAGHGGGRPNFNSQAAWGAYWFYSENPSDPMALEYYETDAATVLHKIQLVVGAVTSQVKPGCLRHPDGRVTDGKLGGQTLTAIARVFSTNGDATTAAAVTAGRIDRATWEKILAFSFHPEGRIGNVALPPNAVMPPVCGTQTGCPSLGTPRTTVHTYKWEGQRDAREYNAFTGGRPTPPPELVRVTERSPANTALWVGAGMLLLLGIGLVVYNSDEGEASPQE